MTARVKGSRFERPLPADGLLRVAIEAVQPQIDGGRHAVKRTPGEAVRVSADIFGDGHDALAGVLRYRQTGRDGRAQAWQETPLRLIDNDRWGARFVPMHIGDYQFTIEAWVDAFASWRSALARRLAAHQVGEGDLLEGAALIRAAAARAQAASNKPATGIGGGADADEWLRGQAHEVAAAGEVERRARLALQPALLEAMQQHPDRRIVTTIDRPLPLLVERERARVGAWYEMFPRSASPEPGRSGTFGEAAARVPEIAALGFDVLYLPPIHPIGTTARKGPGNAEVAGPGDPGSPWAIGSPAGGHMAIEPGLGTLDDFDHFVTTARDHGLEIALDLAYQCSPDHPYVREHPEWFRHRPDGSIKYAENPPKKYQDIYPIDFDCAAWPALWEELKRVVLFWTARGVRIFRVDNPHTKPFRFWEWMIRSVRDEHPDVIFLAEAFTRPKVMMHLAKLGFSQSYTYFTWRNTKPELTAYFTELTQTPMREYFRPNLFANTPDILHSYLQSGGRAAFEIRLVLAATLGATYGIYSGFELCDGAAVPGSEEYLNSEKYDYRPRNWDAPGHIKDLVRRVNDVRRAEPALQDNETLTFHDTDNPSIVAYSKRHGGRGLLMVATLDPHHVQEGFVQVPRGVLGIDDTGAGEVEDLLDGARYRWTEEWSYVRFEPGVRIAHVLKPTANQALPTIPPAADVAQLLEGAARDCIESDVLGRFMQGQRWFAGKARTLVSTRVVDSPRLPGTTAPLWLAIVDARYTDGTTERYQLPLTVLGGDAAAQILRDAPGAVLARLSDEQGSLLCDGVQRDEACRAMFASALGPAHAAGLGATSAELAVTRLSATHSNSAVALGGRYLLKVFRRLEPGVNPDVEVGQFLASQRAVDGGDRDVRIPALLGTIDYRSGSEPPLTLALVQELVPNDGTGWDLALRSLARTTTGPQDLDWSELLGRRTVAMHRALAAGPPGSDFTAERLSARQADALIAAMRRSAQSAVHLLAARQAALTGSSVELATQVLHHADALLDRFGAAATLLADLRVTRIHGDYHLGQVLHTEGDFAIIDFEGEPARPLAERRARQSPLRDVAGMLRSFSYAAHTAGAAATTSAASAWEQQMSVGFLRGYLADVDTVAFLGLPPAQVADVLALFVLDKAFYELAYELNNRPDWVSIPLAGLLSDRPT